MQVIAVDESLQGGRQHLLVGGFGIGRVGTGKGDTIPAEDGDAADAGDAHGLSSENVMQQAMQQTGC